MTMTFTAAAQSNVAETQIKAARVACLDVPVCALDSYQDCHERAARYAGIDPAVWAYDAARLNCPWLPEAIDGCYRVDTDAILDERFPRERTGGADWSVRGCWRVGTTPDGFGSDRAKQTRSNRLVKGE